MNLISNARAKAWKSTEKDAYDASTGKWKVFDGSTWVAASKAAVAYFMDPRNYLNDRSIYMFELLEYQSQYQTKSGVNTILSNTPFYNKKFSYTDVNTGAAKTMYYVTAFMEAAKISKASPYHLASRVKQEVVTSATTTSTAVTGTVSSYPGIYNFYNIGATSSSTPVLNGLKWASDKKAGTYLRPWTDPYRSIVGGAQYISSGYIAKGQNTCYLEKFNVTSYKRYSHQYMTNVQAAMSEGKTMSTAYADKSQGFIFRIPVYSNMPESAVTFSDSGNPNNWLSSLSVSGYGLTPSFQGAVTDYSVIVGTEVSSINVGASAVAPKAGVSGAGTYALNYGNNAINVTCVSQSGSAKTYTINVVRQQPAADNTQTPESGGTTVADGISVSTSYKLGDTVITGITPGTGASSVLANISAGSGTVKVLKADGTENTGAVGTGNKIAVYANGTLVKQYDVVIYGDINGDGKISVVDLVMMQKQILGTSQLSGAYAAAADISRDGKVSVKDLVLLQKHIINAAQIEQ